MKYGVTNNMKRKIKDYTTDIAAEKTIIEINAILQRAKVRGVMTEFDDDGQISAIFFRVPTGDRELSFKLPAKPESVYKRLYAGKRSEYRYRKLCLEKSRNIAWRIVKDWLEVQITMIELEQAEVSEVFLPYLLVEDGTVTLFEQMKQKQFLLTA
jgi:hypothetical protein